MRNTSFRLVIVLVFVLLLVAMASAQPSSEGYDQMDLDWWETELDLFSAVANNEAACMTNSPPQFYVDPSRLSQPIAGDERDHVMPYPVAGSHDNRQTITTGFRNGPQTYAAVVQHGIAPRQHRQLSPAPQQQQPLIALPMRPQQQRSQLPMQPPIMPLAPFAGPSGGASKTYAEALRSPPATQQYWPSYVDQASTMEDVKMERQDQGLLVPAKQLLPEDITSNPNFHMGMSDPADNLGGWVAQPRTAHDRVLRLDTNRLSPYHTPATHLSPASVTSPSSSRLSNRRTRQEMMHGNFPHRCRTCGAGFDRKGDLTHHLRSHTPEERRRHACGMCLKRFLYHKDLTRHQAVHLPKHLFCPYSSCKHAAKGFSRQDHLDRHVRSQHAVDSAIQSSQPPSLPDL